MDHATDPLLRPPTKLTDHLYCMGYSRTSRSSAGRWYNFPVVQQKMVCCFLTHSSVNALLMASAWR